MASPLYVLTTNTLEKELGITTLAACIELMVKSITAAKGKLVVKEPPRCDMGGYEDDALRDEGPY